MEQYDCLLVSYSFCLFGNSYVTMFLDCTCKRKPSRWAWWKALKACLTPSSAERLEEPVVRTSGVMRAVELTSQPCTQGWHRSVDIRRRRRGSTVRSPTTHKSFRSCNIISFNYYAESLNVYHFHDYHYIN